MANAVGGARRASRIWKYGNLLKAAAAEWREDKVSRLAAALSYYTILSLVPLLTIGLALAGSVFGREAAEGRVAEQLQEVVGPSGAKAVLTLVNTIRSIPLSRGGAILGVVALLFGASNVFHQLRDTLNTIWQVKGRPGRGLKGELVDRFRALVMVFGMGLLLVISLGLAAALSQIGHVLRASLPGLPSVFTFKTLHLLLGFGVNTLLFALMYKLLPDTEITWKDVRVGAAITALLFTAGQFLIGVYLGNTQIGAIFGPAGAVVILLAWVYFSAQLVFFGAELTWVYANTYGSRIVPSQNAAPLLEADAARQGIEQPSERASAALQENERGA
jgi:membrane protein